MIRSGNTGIDDRRDEADPPDLTLVGFGKPDVPIGPDSDPGRPAPGSWNRKFLDSAGSRDAPDLISIVFGEPEVPVRAGGDLEREALAGRNRELRDDACRRDSTDLAWELREPAVPVGAGGDGVRVVTRTPRGERELRDPARRRNPSDCVAANAAFSAPEVSIRTCCDVAGVVPTI